MITLAGEELAVGTEIPTVVRFTSNRQLVQYAAAAHDYSGIHYDRGYAQERGFPDVIVHGFLKAAFLADLAVEWAGAGSAFESFSARYSGVDLVGAPITCHGRVTAIDADTRRLTLELWTENAHGSRTTTATGVLRLPNEGTR